MRPGLALTLDEAALRLLAELARRGSQSVLCGIARPHLLAGVLRLDRRIRSDPVPGGRERGGL
jgi:hypothetical protein